MIDLPSVIIAISLCLIAVVLGILLGANFCEWGHPYLFQNIPNFCPDCGEQFYMICPDCGNSVSFGNSFCKDCGYQFIQEDLADD